MTTQTSTIGTQPQEQRALGKLGVSALHQVIVMTRLTFREAQRRKLLWLGLGLGLAFVALFSTGFYFIYTNEVPPNRTITEQMFDEFMFNWIMTAGLYVVNFLVIMVTVLTSVGTLSGEIDSNTIHSVAAKPIRRWQIVLGKWIGHAMMLAMYTVLMSAGIMIAVRVISGYAAPNAVAVIAILILESLVTLSVSMLGGARFSTLANGVIVFMLYGLAFVGGWVETIGALLGSQTATDIGIASSLFMPSEALWRFAANVLQPDRLMAVNVTPFSVTSQPTTAFLIYAIGYTLFGLLGAMWVFTKRDV